MDKLIAVSFAEYRLYGCVACGCDYAFNPTCISGGGGQHLECGECGVVFYIVSDGLKKSSWTDCPEIQTHPRVNTPKHPFVLPDLKPEGEGEFFSPRGVGYDLAGFVKSKEGGARIVKMFEVVLRRSVKTWLDYRKHEPTWIQVKVQKEDCDLELLEKLTAEGIITIDKIKQATQKIKK
jgi:hypothetical protein